MLLDSPTRTVASSAGATHTPSPTSLSAVTRTPIPTAPLTLPPTLTPREPTATSIPSTPTKTPTPSVTPSPTSSDPIGVENDQGCFDSAVNELWILGEIANRTAEHYDVNDIFVDVFDASGPITSTIDTFEMPGIFAVPARGRQPFYLIVALEQPTYTRYALTIDAAPGPHTFRGDLSVQFTGTTPDDGDILVNGAWTNPGPKLDYASPYATVYTAGRVSNMGYEYRSDVITGTYTYQIRLPANPCPAGSIVVNIIGE